MTAELASLLDLWRKEKMVLLAERETQLVEKKTRLGKEKQLVAQISELASSRCGLSEQCKKLSLTTHCIPEAAREARRLREQVCCLRWHRKLQFPGVR